MDVRIDGHEGQTALAKSASPTNNSVIGCKRISVGRESKFLRGKRLDSVFAGHTLIIQPFQSNHTDLLPSQMEEFSLEQSYRLNIRRREICRQRRLQFYLLL